MIEDTGAENVQIQSRENEISGLTSRVREKTHFAWLIATVCGVGFWSPGSGTWASALTVVFWAGAARFIPAQWRWPAALAIAAGLMLVGIWTSTVVARESLTEDPGFVVIDEVAGQMVALIASPLGWKYLVASLVLFRIFDILKPPPLRLLEKLPEGTGIMVDDLGAGLYSWLLLHAALRLGF